LTVEEKNHIVVRSGAKGRGPGATEERSDLW
jgi:hypothetical protein